MELLEKKYSDLIEELVVKVINSIFLRRAFELTHTASKVSKYGVISGPYFPVFGLNTEIYGVAVPRSGRLKNSAMK